MITCSFANGSDASGCEAVLTCTEHVLGKLQPSEVKCLIAKSAQNLNYATGNFPCSEISDCLTYDLSVYDVFADGSTGKKAVITKSNILVRGSSLSAPDFLTSSQNVKSVPSPSNSVMALGANLKGIYLYM